MTLVTSVAEWTNLLWKRTLPQLTWYGPQRIELNGPVLARWFAKTSNFLMEEFPFGLRSLGYSLPLAWQSVPWLGTCWLRGVPITDLRNLPREALTETPDALLSDAIPALEWATQNDALPLALSTDPMALAWDGALPAGVEDASAALLSQSDTVLDDVETHLTQSLFTDPSSATVADLMSNPWDLQVQQRVLFTPTSNAELALRTLQAFWAGAAVVVATTSEARELALRQERIDVAQ